MSLVRSSVSRISFFGFKLLKIQVNYQNLLFGNLLLLKIKIRSSCFYQQSMVSKIKNGISCRKVIAEEREKCILLKLAQFKNKKQTKRIFTILQKQVKSLIFHHFSLRCLVFSQNSKDPKEHSHNPPRPPGGHPHHNPPVHLHLLPPTLPLDIHDLPVAEFHLLSTIILALIDQEPPQSKFLLVYLQRPIRHQPRHVPQARRGRQTASVFEKSRSLQDFEEVGEVYRVGGVAVEEGQEVAEEGRGGGGGREGYGQGEDEVGVVGVAVQELVVYVELHGAGEAIHRVFPVIVEMHAVGLVDAPLAMLCHMHHRVPIVDLQPAALQPIGTLPLLKPHMNLLSFGTHLSMVPLQLHRRLHRVQVCIALLPTIFPLRLEFVSVVRQGLPVDGGGQGGGVGGGAGGTQGDEGEQAQEQDGIFWKHVGMIKGLLYLRMRVEGKDLTQVPNLGIPQSMFKFGCVNMQNQKYISFLEAQTKTLTVLQLQNNFNVAKRSVMCSGALMHPTSNVLVVYAEGPVWTLQIFNVELKQKLRSCDFKEKILFVKWITDTKLAVVTEKSFYHIPIESGAQDRLIFHLDVSFENALKAEFGQIVGYSSLPNQSWTACYMISTPDKGVTIEGRVQLTFGDKQQLLKAFGCAFGRIPLHEKEPPITAFFSIMKQDKGYEVLVSQISPPVGNFPKHKVTREYPKDLILEKDFPIQVMFSEKLQKIYAVTKFGMLFVFEPLKGELVGRHIMINNDSLLLARLNTKTEGVIAISKKGILLRADPGANVPSPSKQAGPLSDIHPTISSSKLLPKHGPTLTIGTPLATLILSQLPTPAATQLPEHHASLLKQFQSLVSQSPAAALIYLKALPKPPHPSTLLQPLANILIKSQCFPQLTQFVLTYMSEPLPQYCQYQSIVLGWNVKNNPRVAEAILDLGLFAEFQREKVRGLCEEEGYWEMAIATMKEEELYASGGREEVEKYVDLCIKAIGVENQKKIAKYVQCLVRAIYERAGVYDVETVLRLISQLDDPAPMYALSIKHPISLQYVQYLISRHKIEQLCQFFKQTDSRQIAGAALQLLGSVDSETLLRVLDTVPEFSDPESILEAFRKNGNMNVLRQWLERKTKAGGYNVLANKLTRIMPEGGYQEEVKKPQQQPHVDLMGSHQVTSQSHPPIMEPPGTDSQQL